MKKTTKQTYNDLMYRLYGVGNKPIKRKPLTTKEKLARFNKKCYGI